MANFLSTLLGDVAGIFGLGNLVGGSQQGGSTNRNTYVPTGLGTADTTFQQLLQALSQNTQGQSQTISPQNLAAYQALMNVPTQGLQQAGQQAGGLAQGQVGQALGAQNFFGQNAQNLAGAGQQVYNTALDPQQALYNRTAQQVQDASRAGSAARGINMGGEAAGLENQAMSNFNIDWQNQQLARQLQGLQGMGQATNQAGQQMTGGLAAGGLAPGYAMQGGTLPYQANTQAAGAPLNYANLYNTAQGGTNQQLAAVMSQIIPYLNQGLGATGQAFNQGQTGLNNLYSLGSSIFGTPQGGGQSPWQAFTGLFSSPQQTSGGGGGYGSSDPNYGAYPSGF